MSSVDKTDEELYKLIESIKEESYTIIRMAIKSRIKHNMMFERFKEDGKSRKKIKLEE